MAAKPWESKSMEQNQSDPSEITPTSFCSYSSEYNSENNVRRNNVSKRISARPPLNYQKTPCSEFMYDESTTSSSSASASETPKPSYMSLTESIKAKKRACNREKMQRRLIETVQFHKKPTTPSNGNARRSTSSDLYSVDLCKDLYPPMHLY